jgi:hypothetical protein
LVKQCIHENGNDLISLSLSSASPISLLPFKSLSCPSSHLTWCLAFVRTCWVRQSLGHQI